jgi:RNA polymerase sigma-70 factor (ECF subfamily)
LTRESSRLSDEELMQAYQLGGSFAFDELYRRYASRVYSFLRKKVSQPEEVDEVFQRTFAKIHQARGSYDPKFLFSQWLFTACRTSIADHFRSLKRQDLLGDQDAQELLENYPDLSQTGHLPTYEEERGINALNGLSPEQRMVVELRVFDELSYGEIAKRLGRSEAAVRQVVSRSLSKVRLALSVTGSKR